MTIPQGTSCHWCGQSAGFHKQSGRRKHINRERPRKFCGNTCYKAYKAAGGHLGRHLALDPREKKKRLMLLNSARRGVKWAQRALREIYGMTGFYNPGTGEVEEFEL